MRHSIATVSLSGMLREKLQAAAAAGFDGVEIFETDLLQFPGSPREVRQICQDLGLTIDLFQPFRDFDARAPAQLTRNLERAERKFDAMHELGTSMILVCSNVQPDALDNTEQLAEQFHQLAERAGQRGLFIAYEALAWGSRINRFSQAWDVVRRANHPNLGMTLDSFHTLALRDDPLSIAQLPAGKIFFVQLADAPWVNTDVLSHSRHYRCFPGQGELEITKFTRAVIDAGYTGPLSLEVFNDEFRAAPARANAVDAKRSLLWLEDQVRQSQARDSVARKVALFAPLLTGWAFVEFAVDPAAGSRLTAWLETCGFGRVGQHRSKQVAPYGQGEVCIIINLEEDSLARTHFEQHGTSVCAVALAMPDVAGALARAEALRCPRVAGGRLGHNELIIPAVRAPDGSLVYFCESPQGNAYPFEADFAIDAAALHGGPLGEGVRFDHLVQAVPAGQVEPWVLFHRAVLGLVPERNVVMHDPYGIIKSREIESSDRLVRASIVVSERDNTSVSRAVSSFHGAGVQQIAIAVGNLLATARQLLRRPASALRPRRNVPGRHGAVAPGTRRVAKPVLNTCRLSRPPDPGAPAAPIFRTTMINGNTELIAHIGFPTHAFKAPMIYNPYFDHIGVNARVMPMGCQSADYPAFLRAVFTLTNIRGALVTMPHKVTTLGLLDRVTPTVEVAGSCNAVRRGADGKLEGDMFDGEGFVRGVQRKGLKLAGARVLVVGSGGVGSAIAASLAAAGIGAISLFDMNTAACEGLGGRLQAHYPLLDVRTGSNDPADHDLVVNATPMGMNEGDALPMDMARIAPGTFVGEVVMRTEMTAFLTAAQARDCPVQVGSDMLFEQIPAYLEFFGFPTTTPDVLRSLTRLSY